MTLQKCDYVIMLDTKYVQYLTPVQCCFVYNYCIYQRSTLNSVSCPLLA